MGRTKGFALDLTGNPGAGFVRRLFARIIPPMTCGGDGVIISAGRAWLASGTLVCDTTMIDRGRRVAALESEVRNGERLVAKALGTFAIFPQR